MTRNTSKHVRKPAKKLTINTQVRDLQANQVLYLLFTFCSVSDLMTRAASISILTEAQMRDIPYQIQYSSHSPVSLRAQARWLKFSVYGQV